MFRSIVLHCMLFAIALQATAGVFAHQGEHYAEDLAAISIDAVAHACAIEDASSSHEPEASTVCAWCVASVKPLVFATLPAAFHFIVTQSVTLVQREFSRSYISTALHDVSVRDPPFALI